MNGEETGVFSCQLFWECVFYCSTVFCFIVLLLPLHFHFVLMSFFVFFSFVYANASCVYIRRNQDTAQRGQMPCPAVLPETVYDI